MCELRMGSWRTDLFFNIHDHSRHFRSVFAGIMQKQIESVFYMPTMNPYEPPKTQSSDVASPVNGPAIWNPNAAANWSLLFTPAFGAYLHARNSERLGRHDEARANQRWFYGSLSLIGASTLSAFVPTMSDVPFRLAGLVILLTWYFTVAKKQIAFVKQTFGTGYQKRSLLQPLLIGFACLVGIFVLAFAIALSTELANESSGAA